MLTKVKLRQKPLADGKLSLYLDFYPPIADPVTGKKTRREFLQLHIWEKPKGSLQRQHNADTLFVAEQIRFERENALLKSNIYSDLEKEHIAYLERSEKKFIEYYEESFKDNLKRAALFSALTWEKLEHQPGEDYYLNFTMRKTAIICSAMMPQYLWLATGGKSGLTSERLNSLKGRKIIVFPDIDAFKDWQQKIFTFPHLDIRISSLLEDNATPADRAAHIDLADWILKYLETNNN
ncbi:MAG: hypothetical protein J6R25_04935 [Bacteroidales bacterium]|nr:hypothetical protein [Bacteroidales bacterium]